MTMKINRNRCKLKKIQNRHKTAMATFSDIYIEINSGRKTVSAKDIKKEND